MTRKEKLALRQHLSTRQLMGMQGIASHGITTSNSELVFFLIRPDNLSVLSSEGIRARVTALANLLRAEPAVELLVVDSRESFQRNKEFYQKRLEEETTPAIRKLLIEDMRHLDEILSSSASAREFVLILRRDLKSDMSEGTLRQLEKGICDHGLHVRLADEQDVKRLLAVYYQHDITTDFFQDVDAALAPVEKRIEKLIIFKWNRTYPADRYFDLKLYEGTWHLALSSDFAGYSHERITMEVFER